MLKITRKEPNLHVKAFFLGKLGKPWKPSEMKEQDLQVRSTFFALIPTYNAPDSSKSVIPDLYVELINKNLIVYHLLIFITVW